MRVVAGSARGRRLRAPSGTQTRPTTDRVREAIFNALDSLDLVEGREVLDLFAGSGALGIEALSRGAAAATFVERDRAALRVVEANLAATGLGDRARVVGGEALGWAAAHAGADFDVALLDPPYSFDRWDDLLERLPAGFAVVESGRAVAPPPGWELVRERTYGATVVAFLRRVRPSLEEQAWQRP